MSIQDLGAIGEFISSLVIIVTLIALTLEIRQSKKATLQSNRVANQTIRHDLARLMIEFADLRQAYLKAELHLGGPGWEEKASEYGVDANEFQQIATYMRARIAHWRDQFYTELPEADQMELDNQIRGIGASECYKKLWDELKQTRPLGQDFITHVDRLIA